GPFVAAVSDRDLSIGIMQRDFLHVALLKLGDLLVAQRRIFGGELFLERGIDGKDYGAGGVARVKIASVLGTEQKDGCFSSLVFRREGDRRMAEAVPGEVLGLFAGYVNHLGAGNGCKQIVDGLFVGRFGGGLGELPAGLCT